MHHIHHQIPPKYKIYLVGFSSVLYKTPGHNERSVLNQMFLLFFMCFSEKVLVFMEKVPHFMKTNKTMSICVYICTIYTYMHHQVPPKYDIPSWPSLCTLWMTRSKWKICVGSAVFVVFLVLFSASHVLFMKSEPLFIQKVPLFMKTNKAMSICVYTCTI